MKFSVTNKKQTASFGIVGLMLTIAPLGLMLAVANVSAQTSNDVSSSTTIASTPSETVLGVGNVGTLQLKWKKSIGLIIREGMASPVVAKGIVYCSLFDNPATALNASTGATSWTFLKADDSFPLAVANGIVYVGGEDGNIYALNANTGAKLWNFTPAAAPSFIVASGGVVYVGSNDDSVYALNASTGAKLWNVAVEGFPGSSAVANGVVYVGISLGTGPGTVDALNANTGALLWKYATGGTVVSSPAVANGVVYVASNDGTLDALNASTGAKLWDFATGDSTGASPAVANGVVYVGSTDNNVYALNASTGAKLWTFNTGGILNSSPAVANGVVYVGTSSIFLTRPGFVYALNASTGAKLWSYSEPSSLHSFTNFSGINVVDGAVYVSVATGDPDPQEPNDFPFQNVYAFSVGADLFLRAQPSATAVHQGDLLTYAFPVWNLGPANADHEVLNTQVPAGTTLDYIRVSGTPGLATCTQPKFGSSSGQIVCHENSSMAPNTTWTVRVTVKVTAPSGTVITANAATMADTPDPNLANNMATVSIKVQ
jgi:outer membrane protein assembly factor BamB